MPVRRCFGQTAQQEVDLVDRDLRVGDTGVLGAPQHGLDQATELGRRAEHPGRWVAGIAEQARQGQLAAARADHALQQLVEGAGGIGVAHGPRGLLVDRGEVAQEVPVPQRTTTSDPGEVARAVAAGVSRLVAGALTPAEREHQLDELAELYGEVTDVRHPFDPSGDVPMRTRAS